MKGNGLTFLEALVVLALVGILAGVVASSGWVQAYRLRAALSEARILLSLARTEAVRGETPTALRLSEGRLEAFLDENGNGQRDGNERTLRTLTPERAELELPTPLRFNGLGQPQAPGRLTLRLGSRAASLCVEAGGAIREVRGSACN
ncbi:MAG: GspH/FimT family pseudopilin [Thermus sp.]|uniref:GspH/FimT family pseudopilin n=1 Tax=Thermus sp. TaxID=275 RepID=UPI00298F1CD8|nr:GspH/FimT family pseudopilin [Thermus sp.]MDW8018262.1 GspH/FimT family pseudopilin [Thermus sp.]